MPDLSVTYMGLSLTNPVVVSSSSMTQSVSGVKKCADNGAGAVVLKSLFEEQIEADAGVHEENVELSIHPEAHEYLEQMGMRLGPKSYLELITGAKKSVDIPVIASVNCVTGHWWTHYAQQIEQAGADALELNISIMPRSFSEDAASVERQFISIVEDVRRSVKLPLAVKIGPYFSSLPQFARGLSQAGASALVLFNRFYQLDIDSTEMKLSSGYQFSSPQELHMPLRWISILSGNLESDLAASTGIHDGAGAVKAILAGASVTQMCSSIFLNGFGQIRTTVDGIETWMKNNNMKNVAQFRGKLSQKGSRDPAAYERLQYIKALTGVA